MEKLKKEKRWICWDWRDMPNGKRTKVPMCTRGGFASSTDPETWSTYEEAKKASEMFAGIGVVFTPDQTLLGIDIDHVIDTGCVPFEIMEFIKKANTYTEISPSGDGLHLYLSLTEPLKLTSNKKAPYEAYTSGRFFTFTERDFGAHTPIRTVSKQEALDILSIIGYPWKKPIVKKEYKTGVSEYPDNHIRAKMFKSKNGLEIHDLWNDTSQKYNGDKSSEDFALLCHLAFWTRKDPIAMERIWLNSPLGQRSKTQEREDYRKRTLEAVLSLPHEIYAPHLRTPRETTITPKTPLTNNISPNVGS